MIPITFKEAWDLLGEVPVDTDDNIETPYLDFPVGTDKFEIWHWLEEHYNVKIGDLFN